MTRCAPCIILTTTITMLSVVGCELFEKNEQIPANEPNTNVILNGLELTEKGRQIWEDESGETFARALNDHIPTEAELKDISIFWALFAMRDEVPDVNTILLESGILEALEPIANHYPSMFLYKQVGFIYKEYTFVSIQSSSDFDDPSDCYKRCIPHPSMLADTGFAIVDQLTGSLAAIKKLPQVAALANELKSGLETVKATRATLTLTKLRTHFSASDVVDIINAMATIVGVLGTTGAVAAFASVEVAAVAAVIAAVTTVISVVEELMIAKILIDACREWQELNCFSISGVEARGIGTWKQTSISFNGVTKECPAEISYDCPNSSEKCSHGCGRNMTLKLDADLRFALTDPDDGSYYEEGKWSVSGDRLMIQTRFSEYEESGEEQYYDPPLAKVFELNFSDDNESLSIRSVEESLLSTSTENDTLVSTWERQ